MATPATEHEPAAPSVPEHAPDPATDQAPKKIARPIKVFGVWCMISGGLMVLTCVGIIVATVLGYLDESISRTQSLILVVISLALNLALGALYVVFGMRLLKDNRRHSAALARTIMAALIALLLVDLMITGPATEHIATVIEILVLIVLQTYLDPSLAEERRLRRALRRMDERSAEEERIAWLKRTGGKAPYKLNFFNIFWTFVICAVLGLIIEDLYCALRYHTWQDRAGLLFGPFSPIYGFGAALMTLALNNIRNKNPFLIFLCSAVIGGAFEYFTSWFMQFAFGITAWDYTGTFLSIDGRTNASFMLCWGILGMVWIRFLLPVVFKLIYMIPWNWRYSVTAVATAFMIIDGAMTLQALDCWYERTSGQDSQTSVQKFYAEHFDNDYMTNRFQTMTMDVDSATRIETPDFSQDSPAKTSDPAAEKPTDGEAAAATAA